MKKFFSVIFFLALAIFLIGPEKSTSAAYGSDSKTYAPIIDLGATITDTIQNYNEVLHYRFEVPETGKIRLAIDNLEDVKLVGTILDEQNNSYGNVETDKNSLTGQRITELGLKKGTYFVKIETYSYFYNKNYKFKFKVTYTKGNTYEVEYNDSPSTATTIALNKQYNGSLQASDDVDYYKFKLNKAGKVKVSLSNVPGTKWNVKVFSELNKEYAYESFTTDGGDFAKGVASVDIGLPKGNYYIKVTKESNTYNVPYKLKVTYTASNSYEIESNNTIPEAMKIQLNKTYSAIINNSSGRDTDVFKFVVPNSGNVKFTMTQLAGARWNIYIYNSAGTELLSFSTNNANSAAKYLTQTKYLSKGTYYFYVESEYWNSARWKPYSFSISMKTSTPKAKNITVKNNKGKKDTITVKGIKKGTVVRVYNTKSKVIAKGTSKGASITLSVKQLGKKAGKVYVTVQNPGYDQSSKVTVKYKGE